MNFSIALFLVALLAGITTVFAPCIFTFLPVVLGGAAGGKRRLWLILLSLGTSVFAFTLLLRASTVLIDVHPAVWELVAGGIIFVQGLLILFPEVWDRLSTRLGLSRANSLIDQSNRMGGALSDVLLGSALGPIFSACSPTYGFIIGAVLQTDVPTGIIYLCVYIFGLLLMLALVAFGGQRLVARLKWGVDPHGLFKRFVALVFILLGWSIIFGIHRQIETFIVQQVPFLDATQLERELLQMVVE